MRWLLNLLIATGALTWGQSCGPPIPNCDDSLTSPVADNPCWGLSQNVATREYCHKGKDLRINVADNDKSAVVNCDGQTLDCASLPNLNFSRNGKLESLKMTYCGMNASLGCVLTSLNATDAIILILDNWETDIGTETLRGLSGLVSFMVFNSRAVTKVPIEAFKVMPILKGIRMHATSIGQVTSNMFLGLHSNVTYLEISSANLTELPADGFNGLSKLDFLNLFKNNISILDENAFRGLPSLKKLALDDNAVLSFPDGLFTHTPNLTEILLKGNRVSMRIRNTTFAGLTKLEKIEISMYDNDGRLSLDSSALAALPSLTSCDLSGAGIEVLPADLFQGTKALVTLKLSDNEISSLPESVFEDLENLKELYLSNNKLRNLEENMPLYSSPFSLRKLQTLTLAGNQLQQISPQLFAGAPSLQSLDLSRNQLSFVCRVTTWILNNGTSYGEAITVSSPLSALDRLTELNLSHNNLSHVCNDFTNVMLTLRTLDLSYNRISSLTNQDVQFLSNDIKVDLRHNNITKIQPENLQFQQEKDDAKKTSAKLIIGNNPFNCDCNNYDLLKQFKNLNYDFTDATCIQPESLKGVSLKSIAESQGNLSLDKLICTLPDAPEQCECLVRRSKNRTECVCNSAVTNLPDPNNITKNLNIIDDKYDMLLTLKTIDNLERTPRFVTDLNLSNLSLNTVPNIPKHIGHVDLTYNKLERIPMELLSRNLTFDLSHNSFECACASKADISNLMKFKQKIRDYTNLSCLDGIKVEDVQLPRLCDIELALTLGISVASLGILIGLATILVYKYWLEIRIYLYNKGLFRSFFKKDADASKKYDIFLSFCHEDEIYVIDNLLPNLDANYKVCVHTRDFEVGEDIVTQIYRAVADSRRTLIIASYAYFKSPWCLEEMRAAYKQTELDKMTRAIVILRKDVDTKSDRISETVRSYLNLNTWMREDDTRFWDKLCYSLPRYVTIEDIRRKKVAKKALKNLGSERIGKESVANGTIGTVAITALPSNGHLPNNLRGVNLAKTDALNNEVKLAINNLPGGLKAVCNNGKLAKNLTDARNGCNGNGLAQVNVYK